MDYNYIKKLDFWSSGSLGDVYIVVCKLKTYGNVPIRIYHHTKIIEWEKEIREIYSLLPNVEVRFNEELPYDIPYISPVEKSNNTKYFPKWNIKNKFDLPSEYSIIACHSGKDNSNNMKEITENGIESWIDEIETDVVLLGTKKKYRNIDNCINLVSKTSILDTIPVIANSSMFLGPEGLLSFIALSHKIPSHILYRQYEAVEARIIGTPWERYCMLHGI